VETSGPDSPAAASPETSARALLTEADPAIGPLLDRLDADAPLIDAGVDSAQLVELALLLEERFGAPLDAAELDRLSTLRSIDELLSQRAREA
jgi:acyl carrier protein